MKTFNQDDAYSRAQYKVNKIKRFYKHLAAYIIVNLFIQGIKIFKNFNFGDSFSDLWIDINFHGLWLIWGIGLAFHAFAVFGTDYFFGKNWEENKIQKLMDKEEDKVKPNNR